GHFGAADYDAVAGGGILIWLQHCSHDLSHRRSLGMCFSAHDPRANEVLCPHEGIQSTSERSGHLLRRSGRPGTQTDNAVKNGEQVLHPMVRFTSKQPLAVLRLLLTADFHHHANEIRRLAIFVTQALATCLDPTDRSVLLEQPVFLNVLP